MPSSTRGATTAVSQITQKLFSVELPKAWALKNRVVASPVVGSDAITATLPSHSHSLFGSKPQSLPATGGALRSPPSGSERVVVTEVDDDYERIEREAIQAEGEFDVA